MTLRQRATVIAGSLAAVVAAGASVVTPGAGAAAARAVTVTASTVTATGLYANASGMVMDAGGARKPGVAVRVHKDGTANGKRWLREKDRTIRPAYDTRLCLDVPRARYRVGTALDVATCRGIRSQRFAIFRSSGSTPMFFISPIGDRKLCLSLSSGFFDAGDAVTLDRCGPVLTAPGTEVWAATNLDAKAGELDSTIALGVAGSTAGSPARAVQPWALPLGALWEVGTENVAPFGQERVLRSVANTSLCLTRVGAEVAGAALRLETCSGSLAQAFLGIEVLYNIYNPAYYVTEPDGRFCVAITSGAVIGHHAALGHCVGTAADLWTAATWTTGMDLTTQQSYQYQEIYTDGYVSPQYSLSLTGTGAGAKTVLAGDSQRASQVWTDLGPSGRVGNPDGSMSLRPLSNQGLCLTVPGAKYASGQQLAAEPCTGKLDQEFFRMPSISFNGTQQQELVPYGDGELCLGMPKGLKAGAAVTLLPCSRTQAQAWNPMEAWYHWGGEPAGVNAYPLGVPPQRMLTVSSLTGTSATAATAPFSMGSTSLAWFPVTSSDGTHETFRLAARTGWCLDATTTAVTAQACNGATSQEFTFSSEVGGDGISYLQLNAAAAPGFCVSAGTGSGTVPVTLTSCAPGVSSQMWYVYAPLHVTGLAPLSAPSRSRCAAGPRHGERQVRLSVDWEFGGAAGWSWLQSKETRRRQWGRRCRSESGPTPVAPMKPAVR